MAATAHPGMENVRNDFHVVLRVFWFALSVLLSDAAGKKKDSRETLRFRSGNLLGSDRQPIKALPHAAAVGHGQVSTGASHWRQKIPDRERQVIGELNRIHQAKAGRKR